MVLLKLVIQAMPLYVMSCFRIPDNVLMEIESMIGNFLAQWEGQENPLDCLEKTVQE